MTNGQHKMVVMSTCKPFIGDDGVRQRNAILSWVNAVGASNVLLVGDELGVAEIAQELGVKNDTEVKRVDGPLPGLDAVMKTPGLQCADVVCYVNADIILPNNLLEAVQVVSVAHEKYLIVGERWSVDLPREVTINELNDESLSAFARSNGFLPGPHWIDYFIFPQGLLGEIPPLAVAGYIWDHWIVGRAIAQGAQIVDATDFLTAIHQEHPRRAMNIAETKRANNLQFVKSPADLATISHSTLVLTSMGGLEPAAAMKYRFARLLELLGPLVRLSRPIRTRLGLNLDKVFRVLRR
jgi:hypothetical protein